MNRWLSIFWLKESFYEGIAPPAPVLLAGGRNRPARPPSGCDARFARWLGLAVFRKSDGNRRSDLRRLLPDQGLDPGKDSDDGGGRASQERAAARSFLRHESAAVPRSRLSHRLQFFGSSDAARQSLRGFVVVSQRILSAQWVRRKNRVVKFPRHQLSRQYFSQRKADCQLQRCCRRMADLRVQRHVRGQTRNECARGAGMGADGKQPGHHFCGLESCAARQGHGPVA